MLPDPRRPIGPALALLLGLLLLLAPASSLAQSPPSNGSDEDQSPDQQTNEDQNGTGDNSSSGSTNQTQDGNRTTDDDRSGNQSEANSSEEGNQSSSTEDRDERRSESRSETSGEDNQAPSERPDRRSGDQRARTGGQAAADPVEIDDLADGFRTQPPAGSLRPAVTVDAARGQASVDRTDVVPLSMQIDSVLEYIDEDGDDAYDLGERVVNRTDLRQAPHRIEVDPANDTRSVVYLLDSGGHLELRFSFITAVDPQVGTKLDVIIRNHTFAEPDARLAVGSHVEAAGGLETVELDGQPALAGTEGDEVAYLSWVPVVTVDGVDHEVGWSVHLSTSAEGQDAIVYWSYPQGEEIVHDPELGVTSAVKDLAGQLTPFTIAIGAAIVVLGTGYVVRRRGRL